MSNNKFYFEFKNRTPTIYFFFLLCSKNKLQLLFISKVIYIYIYRGSDLVPVFSSTRLVEIMIYVNFWTHVTI